jgi:Carboxypeptidase regulatory-like domain
MELFQINRISYILCIISVLLLSLSPAHAQVSSAQITGVVTDSSGAVLSGVSLQIVNQGTNAIRNAQTNQSGDFIVPALEPGDYRITVEASGFRKVVIDHVTLNVGDKKALKFTLQVGATQQSVTVTSGGELINATSAEISTIINEQEVKELPLNGRDPSSLVLLTTGVTNVLNTSAGVLQASIPTETAASAGGGRQGSTYYLLDGVPNMDTYVLAAAPFPNADATQEFRVISNNYDAQYGFSPSAVVSIQTKSGTDVLHGTVFEFIRNNDLNAGNYFTHLVDPLKRNQFGGGIGGPLLKHKLFFFANYQATRASEASSTNTTFTPTETMLHGDFSAVPQPLTGPFHTVNGVPNQVDPSLFSPGSLALAHVMPVGQTPGSGAVNYVGPGYKISYDEGTARIDYALSDRQHVTLRSFILNYNSPSVTIPGNILATSLNPAGENGRFYNEVLSHTWTISPTLVNVFEGSWTRMDAGFGGVVKNADGSPFCLSQIINIASPGQCYINNLAAANGFSTPAAQPYTYHRISWGFSDSITKTIGNHLLSGGVDAYHQLAHEVSSWPSYPGVYFSGYATGFGLADFLLGDVSTFQQGGGEVNVEQGWLLGAYAQDQYHVRQSLTVTAGVRWEPTLPAVIDGGHGAAFVPGQQSQRFPNAPVGMVFIGDPGIPAGLMPSNYNVLEPRIGIVYQPRSMPNTAFRAGFGTFVAPMQYSEYSPFGDVPPFDPTYTLNATPANPISFDNPWTGFAATGGKSPFPPFASASAQPPKDSQFLTPVTIPGTFSRNFKLGATQSWNASIEQQFRGDIAMHLAYVGSQSYHQSTPLDLNPGIYADQGARSTYPQMGPILEMMTAGTASYHSLQASLNKHLSHGLQFQSSFTWSKGIDLSSIPSLAWTGGIADPFDLNHNRGISNLNFPLISITSFIYQTPGLKSSGMLTKNIFGSWQLSTIWTLQSGQPFGIVGGDGNNNSGALQYGDRADLTGQPYNVRQGSKVQWINQYFNPAAFQANAPGTFGNSPRNLFQAPGTNTADVGIDKDWQIQEKYDIQFRWEMFNAFNRPSFGIPNNDPSSSNFGQITNIGVTPPRVMQGALKFSF